MRTHFTPSGYCSDWGFRCLLKLSEWQSSASASNAQARKQYRNQLKVREADWERQRGVYQYKQTVFDRQIDENNEALAMAYQAEQQRLDDLYDTVAFSNQSDLIAAMQAIGQTRARGVSGVSAQRAATSTLSQLEGTMQPVLLS